MKFMITANFPIDVINDVVKSGKLGEKIQSILEEIKPESVYFAAKNGQRTCIMVVDINDASQLPRIAEPLFLAFNASIEILPLIELEDLAKAGPDIENAVRKFG